MTRYFIHEKGEEKVLTSYFTKFSDAIAYLKKMRERYPLIIFGLGKFGKGVKEFNVREQ